MLMKPRAYATASLALALAVTGWACDNMRGRGKDKPAATDAGAGMAQKPRTESSTILIGEYGSLTGSEATFGQSTHNGIMLYIKEINAAGGVKGKKLEVKTYDTQGRAQEAGTAVTRLITDDKAVAILG
jgi:branched-chain amino acid transport system substrate-binding protein